MPDFLCKNAHRVGERQGAAIVGKLEAALDAACRCVKFPIGNLGEIGCTLFARERFDAASARNAGTLRERRHHIFTFLPNAPYPVIPIPFIVFRLPADFPLKPDGEAAGLGCGSQLGGKVDIAWTCRHVRYFGADAQQDFS